MEGPIKQIKNQGLNYKSSEVQKEITGTIKKITRIGI
jgi:hypothetical protein